MAVVALNDVIYKLAVSDAFLGWGELPDGGECFGSFVQLAVSFFVVHCHEGEAAVAVGWVDR